MFETDYSIDEVRKDLNKVVEYFKAKPYWRNAIDTALIAKPTEGSPSRWLSEDIVLESDAFFIDEDDTVALNDEWLTSYPLGLVKNKRFIYEGRIVYPIKDVRGDVMGFVGWDPYTSPKYLDSRNYGYKAKEASLAGMEKMRDYLQSKEPVYLVEGYVDCLWLRSVGLQALSSLGSHLTPYVEVILKRFGNRLIVMPDADEAGNNFVKQVKKSLPKASIFQTTKNKDVDGQRKMEDGKYLSETIRELKRLSNPFNMTKLFVKR